MEAQLIVSDYDLILEEVKARYPNVSTDTQHAIALQMDKKLEDSRARYIKRYNDLEEDTKNEDVSEKLESLDKNIEDFMKHNRSYQNWTTRYARVSSRI